MPIYEFECGSCDAITERMWPLSASENMVTSCQLCGFTAKKVPSQTQAVKPDWDPYVDHNLGDKPVMVQGRGHRKELMKENNLIEADISSTRRKELKQKLKHLKRKLDRRRREQSAHVQA